MDDLAREVVDQKENGMGGLLVVVVWCGDRRWCGDGDLKWAARVLKMEVMKMSGREGVCVFVCVCPPKPQGPIIILQKNNK